MSDAGTPSIAALRRSIATGASAADESLALQRDAFERGAAVHRCVVERATDEFQRQLTVILDPDGDLETALRRFCGEFLAKLTSPEAIGLHRLVLGETRRFPELGRIFYERAPRETQRLLAEFIAGAQARGKLLGIEPIRAAQHLTWLCQSGRHQMLLTGVIASISPAERAEDVDAAMTTFMRAYGEVERRA